MTERVGPQVGAVTAMRYSLPLCLLILMTAGCELVAPGNGTTPGDGTFIQPSEIMVDEEVCCRVKHQNESAKYYRPDLFFERPDGKVVFAGTFGGRPVVWLYSARLEKEWEKRLLHERPCALLPEKGPRQFFISCALDGGRQEILAVGDQGEATWLFITDVGGIPRPSGDGGFIFYESARQSGLRTEMRLSRINASGQLQWSHRFPSDVSIEAFAQQGQAVIAAGDIPGELWWHDRDAVLIGLDARGDEHWRRTFKCELGCKLFRPVGLGDNRFLVQGHFARMYETDNWPFLTRRNVEWLLLVDGQGNIVWDTRDVWQDPQDFGDVRLARTTPRGLEVIAEADDGGRSSLLFDPDGRLSNHYRWPSQWRSNTCGPVEYDFRGHDGISVLMHCRSLSCFRGSCTGDTWARFMTAR